MTGSRYFPRGYVLRRLDAFKAGEWPYGQQAPSPGDGDRALLERVVARAYAVRVWRNRHGQRLTQERARALLWRAAISLPDVYGKPRPGTSDAVCEALRIARKSFLTDKRRCLAALLIGVDQAGCALNDVVFAVLAMPGARSA